VLGFVLAIPRLQTIGVDVDDVYLLLLDTLATVGIFFVLGAMNHVIAKVLGGAASLTSSIVITIYISTALVIVSFLFVPISAWLGALYVSESLIDVGLLVELLQSQDAAKVVVWLVVFGSSVAVAIYWLVVQAKAFRNIHGFGNLGAWTFGILSYLSYSAIATLFLLPLKKAYLHPNVLP
jgi:hypothetical protein